MSITPHNETRDQMPQWQELARHAQELENTSIKALFDQNPKRFDLFHQKCEDLILDYSKNKITEETMNKLIAFAKACDIDGWRNKLFSGEAINTTESRAVLHTALRTEYKTPLMIDNTDIMPQIHAAREKMKNFSTKVRAEKKFKYIVNIGIGGSDLGPSMVYEALKPYTDRDIKLLFISNIDGTALTETLNEIEADKTLFIITSKTFTTQETMTNAHSARNWLQETLKTQDVSEHFVTATQNIDGAQNFGIKPENIFPIWDWVGGRYSLWSTIGLSTCIAIGYEHFEELLKGAGSMDIHFKHAPLMQNIPVLLALIGLWHRNFMNYAAISVTPYDQYLQHLPAYVQQLDMESNGKSVDRENRPVSYKTGPVVIGEVGTNAQHAYFQLLHQGKEIIPNDFIIIAQSQNPTGDHHTKLLSNALAQSKALMEGQEHENPHKAFPGNRPSNTILLKKLTPYNLGMLLALYEHKIFVQGVLWNINSFDQCGVELGKILANQIIDNFNKDTSETKTDLSKEGLLQYIRKYK